MSNIKRDRDGLIYEIGGQTLPPPSSEKMLNRQYYYIKDLEEVCNDLLDRVYELEGNVKQLEKLNQPKPSVER